MSSAADAAPQTPNRSSSSALNPRISSLASGETVNSTPTRSSKNGMPSTKTAQDPELIRNLERRFLEITMDSYIEEILHTPMDTFEDRRSKDWSLVKDELQADIKEYSSAKAEKDMYRPFAAIASHIISRAAEVLGEELEFPFDLQYRNQSSVPMKSNRKEFRVLLPDVVSVFPRVAEANKEAPGISPVNANWNDVFLITEFKKLIALREQKTPDQYTPVASSTRQGSSNSRSTTAVNSSKNSSVGSQSKAKGSSTSTVKTSKQFSNNEKQNSESEPKQSSKSIGKRKASSQLDASNNNSGPIKRKRLNRQEQIASYAEKLISDTGLRSHALGMLIEDSLASLWFFDREGCIRTTRFNFIEEFDRFATILVSFHLLNAYQWGFHHFLEFPKGVLPHMGTDTDAVTMRVGKMCVRLNKTRHIQYGLIGRGTVVYDATVLEGHESLLNKEVVVKTSWQVTTREREDTMLQAAHARLSASEQYAKYVKNIPRIYASREGILLSSLRSRLDNVNEVDFEDRVVRILVFPRYFSIGRLKSLHKIVKCFKDVFYCHRALFILGILHRDISNANVMYWIADGEISGILLDFDLAVFVDEKCQAPQPTSLFRTGTSAFMAIDLLEKAEGPHLYRYDVESLLYVVMWYACNFHDGERVGVEQLPDWFAASEEEIAARKRAITAGLPLPITSTYAPLLKNWILGISLLFSEGYEMKANREKKMRMAVQIENQGEKQAGFESYGIDSGLQQAAINSKSGAAERHKNNITLYGYVTFENIKEVIELAKIPPDELKESPSDSILDT